MSDFPYFESITQEMNALKNRVRHFIGERHWLSEGEWKESVLRAILRRHLPRTLAVGSGFVRTSNDVSTQIDIIIYDTDKPILFQDGDFVIVTPDLVRAIIEVKTTAHRNQLPAQLLKLSAAHALISSEAQCQPFVGFFAYENAKCAYNDVLATMHTMVGFNSRKNIHCISLGEDLFTRFWHCPPETPRTPRRLWRSYKLRGMAPAYFIHNVIEFLCARSVIDNNSVWYPHEGKEAYTLGEQLMESIPSSTT
ncbi:MAG: hypothetical protein EOP84_00995 [Verrucomicrobiaceae bacterium]|nr:MAG: hypothetical protein EOP84_00995 [Verrucomicrobiaceae bacterium]